MTHNYTPRMSCFIVCIVTQTSTTHTLWIKTVGKSFSFLMSTESLLSWGAYFRVTKVYTGEMDRAPKAANIEGISIVSRTMEPNGVECVRIRLEPGSYEAETGFRTYGKFESDWFSGANDDIDIMATPFPMDVDHPSVQGLAEFIFTPITVTPNDPTFVDCIEKRFRTLLPSASYTVEEHYERLSDIALSSTATCAAVYYPMRIRKVPTN